MEDLIHSAVTEKTKKFKLQKRSLLQVLACTLLIIAAGGGSYLWQNTMLLSARSQLATVNAQLTKANAQISTLEKNNSEMQKTIASLQPKSQPKTDLTVTVHSAQKQTENQYTGAYDVVIDVSLTNDTAQAINFTPSDFKLMNTQNNTFIAQNIRTVDCGVEQLPAKMSCLPGQEIVVGQTIRGALDFSFPYVAYGKTPDLSGLKLAYNSQLIPVTLQ